MLVEEILENIKLREIEKENAINAINELRKKLLKCSPIKRGDKVKLTYPPRKYGEVLPDKIEIGMCVSVNIDHYDNNFKYNIYPFKKDGTVSKNNRFYICNDTKIEKIN